MAAKKNIEMNDGLVTVKLPRLPGCDDYVYVSVNNVGYSIKRGEATRVPDFIAAEVERSEAAREAFYDTQSSLSSKN